MHTKTLIIKAHYWGEECMFPDEIMCFSFHRGEHKAFRTLDGGLCHHTQFLAAKDMFKLGYFSTMKEYIKDELHVSADYLKIIEVRNEKEELIETTVPEEMYSFYNYDRVYATYQDFLAHLEAQNGLTGTRN